MIDDRLDDMLTRLAQGLDEASTPSDQLQAMSSMPPSLHRGRLPARPSGFGLAVAGIAAALLVLVVALVAWPRNDSPADVTTGTVPPVPRVALGGGGGPVADGQSVEISGEGFRPQQTVELRQCGPAGCERWRPGVVVEADDSGTFTTQFVVYQDIAPSRPSDADAEAEAEIRWEPCEPCSVQADVGADGPPQAEVPLDIIPTETPLHPSIVLTPTGPYAPGQRVRVEGRGFQYDPDGLETGLAYCPADATRFEECGGGPELGDFGVGPDGTFVVEQFELPATERDLGLDCARRAGTCTVNWFLYSAGPLPAGIPLEIVNPQGGTSDE